ncbi:MAG: DUF6502 family protein [Gammaproteobacteria bacterium]|nr:DUF6502 family protein [Gammaproteobacteria bacterium]
METNTKFNKVITAAIGRILRPLFRVLLRNNLSFNAFIDIAKPIYIDIAMNEFGIPGKKPSISRASILSGLTRKEIQRVLEQAPSPDDEPMERYNRAARVIAGWVRDKDFKGRDNSPQALSLTEGTASFAGLVRRYSGDMPARAVLDELLRVGAVEQQSDGSIRLLARAYIPSSSELDKLDILGTDVSDLITTIDHNLQGGGVEPRFQRKVMYDNLPADVLAEFRKLSAAQSQALLEQLDHWLSQRDRDNNPQVSGTGRMRAGIGIYYFEENLALSPKEH